MTPWANEQRERARDALMDETGCDAPNCAVCQEHSDIVLSAIEPDVARLVRTAQGLDDAICAIRERMSKEQLDALPWHLRQQLDRTLDAGRRALGAFRSER